jgi:hypothetical protein
LLSAIRQERVVNHRRGRPPSSDALKVRLFVETNLLVDAGIGDQRLADLVGLPAPEGLGISGYDRPRINRIRNKLGFKYRPPYHLQKLTATQVAQRVRFCRDMLARMDAAEAVGRELNVVFSDESRFYMQADSTWVRVRPGCWNETATIATVKYPVGVKVWGAIGVDLKPGLVRMSKHVDASEYRQAVLDHGLVEAATAQYGADNFFFMQDGASMHTCEETLAALQWRMQILPGWPPNSADLNPIDLLWAIIGRRLAGKDFHSEDEIFAEVDQIWKELSQDSINLLVRSFRHRLELCLKVNGNSISELLSSHRLEPRPQDIGAGSEIPEFTDDLDAWILKYVEDHGRKWKAMKAELDEQVGHDQFSAIMLKNRWIQLWIHWRNEETVGCRSVDFLLGEVDVMDVFDATDPEADDREAEAAVADEDPIDDEAAAAGTPAMEADDSSDDDEPAARPVVSCLVGFQGFCSEQRAGVKAQNRGIRPRELSRLLGEMWRALEPEQRARYTAEAGPQPKRRTRGPARPKPMGRGAKGGRPKKVHEPRGEGE